MKKALSILLCLAVLAMTLVAVIPASADAAGILDIDGMDYQYYFVGDAVTEAPDITDGVITPGEYSYSEDWDNVSVTPHTSDAHPFIEGVDGSGNNLRGDAAVANAGTETMSVNVAYDAEWVYIAFEAASPTPNFRPFGFTIHNPNPTTYGEMMSRIAYWVKTAEGCEGNTIAEGTHAVDVRDGDYGGDCTWSPRNYIMDDFGVQLGMNGYSPTSPTEDVFAYLTYDTTSEAHILELKIKKTGLAQAFGKEVADISGFGLTAFHVYTNDVATPAYHADFKISYYMQLLDDTQSNLLVEAGDLDVVPAWVPYYFNLGAEGSFTTPAPSTNAPTAAPATSAPAASSNNPAASSEKPADTTAAPATTAAEEKGCGGVIGLSAIALVPTAILGMAIATKKKED